MNYDQIAKTLGLNAKTVKNRTEKAGIINPNTTSIIELFLKHVPINEIAKNLNMNIQQVIRIIPDSFRRSRLEELYLEEKLPYNKIIAKLGISRTSLKNWLKKYDLMNRHPNAGRELKNYPKREIISDYLTLNSVKSISKKRGFAETTIRRILHDADVHMDCKLANIRKHVAGAYNVSINSYLKEVIVGELLGDLSITSQTSHSQKWTSIEQYMHAIENLQRFQRKSIKLVNAINIFNQSLESVNQFPMARFQFCMSILTVPWAQHLKQIFDNNGVPLSSKINDSATVKYPIINLWSGYTVQVAEIYNKWYSNGTKIVPRNFEITPTTLLHWFIGDGNYTNSRIIISTQCFIATDVQYLVNLLSENLGIRSHLRYQKRRAGRGNYPILIIGRQKNVKIFFDYLENAYPQSLSLTKTIFPWKFDGNLRKRDVMRTEWYPEVIHNYLRGEGNVCTMIRKAINQYYFK